MADGLVAGEAEASIDVTGWSDETFFGHGVQAGLRAGLAVCFSLSNGGSRGQEIGKREQNHGLQGSDKLSDLPDSGMCERLE
jgi:hypothetical protein